MERWIALALMAVAAPAAAQEAAAPAPAAEPPGEDLSFLTADTRMTVPVQIAGAGPYDFVIDTGAQRSVISRQLARHLGLPAGRRVRLTAMAGTSEVDTVIVPSLSVSTLGGQQIEAPALEANNLGAPGMLGIDTLQGHALAIDFDTERMTVVPTERRRTRPAGPDEIVIQARDMFGQLVVTNATVAGRRVRVVLDTGTAVSLGNPALLRLLGKQRKGEPAIFTSVLGQQLVGDYAVLREMTLGSATIRSLTVAFADAAPFRAFGLRDKPAILLGMDALRLFRRVRIDFANRELRLVMPRDAIRASPS
ncbi:retroviral-like aspartic protease family protein [Sphingomonas adhaesiva]|uniref:retroviral-like aspartic protease family protein n=1 Tax=Sphingomonas adhaesiva TaxID=28212 RepID=UPI002FF5B07E